MSERGPSMRSQTAWAGNRGKARGRRGEGGGMAGGDWGSPGRPGEPGERAARQTPRCEVAPAFLAGSPTGFSSQHRVRMPAFLTGEANWLFLTRLCSHPAFLTREADRLFIAGSPTGFSSQQLTSPFPLAAPAHRIPSFPLTALDSPRLPLVFPAPSPCSRPRPSGTAWPVPVRSHFLPRPPS